MTPPVLENLRWTPEQVAALEDAVVNGTAVVWGRQASLPVRPSCSECIAICENLMARIRALPQEK